MNLNMHKPKTPKRPGADRRWTLLFIGDHGNVITLKHFKAIMIGIGSLFFLAVVFAAVFFFQNQGTFKQNNDLQKRFADSKKQIEKLRHEKEILMARLVRAEAKTKESVAGERTIPQEKKVAQPTATPPQVASKPKPVEAVKKKPAVPQTDPPKPAPVETDDAEPVIRVAVENFKVLRESGNKNLNAQFKIKNTSTGTQPQRVTGRIVVVLKADDLQANQWLVMPAVGLAGDKPSGKRGKSTSKAPSYSDQFQTAAVYVFTKTGELLLEQDFSVELPPPSVDSMATSSTPKASEKTSSSPEPSSETPESGDASNSLDSMPSVF
jgi:hypothetical protein